MRSRKCLINFVGKDGPHTPNLMTVRSLQQTIKGYGYGVLEISRYHRRGWQAREALRERQMWNGKIFFLKRDSKNAITIVEWFKEGPWRLPFFFFFLITLFCTF